MLSLRRYVYGFACSCGSTLVALCVVKVFLLLLVALFVRYRCYGVILMALRAFARLCLRFTGHFDFALLKLTVAAALCGCF